MGLNMVVVEDVSGIRAIGEDNVFRRRDTSITIPNADINDTILDKRITQFETSASEISDLLQGLQAFPRRCRDAGDYFELQTFYDSEVSGKGILFGGISVLQLGAYLPFGQIVETAVIDLTRKLNERKIKQKAKEIADYIESSFSKASELLFGKETMYGPEKGLYKKHELISGVVRKDKEILASAGDGIEISTSVDNRVNNGNLRVVNNSAVDKSHKPISEVYCMDWNQDRLKNVSSAIGYLERVYSAINGSLFEVKLIAGKDYADQNDKEFSNDALRLASLLRKMAFDSVTTETSCHAVSYQ